MRPGSGNPGRDPRVLLEQQEKCSNRPTVPLFGDGGGAEIRCSLSRFKAATGAKKILYEVQSSHDVRPGGAGPPSHQRGKCQIRTLSLRSVGGADPTGGIYLTASNTFPSVISVKCELQISASKCMKGSEKINLRRNLFLNRVSLPP